MHFLAHRGNEPIVEEHIDFWLLELRSPEFLMEAVRRFDRRAATLQSRRDLLKIAARGDLPSLRTALLDEMEAEKEADRRYWQPLKRQLSELRRERRND